ncbi:peptidoglycan DD-metalloendopeptidase family protein [Marinicella sp. W31]|uniref:peptidoglycan DD-metalloendopeptidase family protein n=1 Tax=Marinicella sp. W31 TaxID=3023713 RepID=UPI0037581E05
MQRTLKYVLMSCCIVIINGCAPHRPAIVEDRNAKPKPTRITRDNPQKARNSIIQVKPGDTLYALGFKYNMDYKVLASYNDIDAPYTIFPGQKIRLTPPPKTQTKSTVTTQPISIKPIGSNSQPNKGSVTSNKPPAKNPPIKNNTSTTTTPISKPPSKPQTKQVTEVARDSAISATKAQTINQAQLKTTLSWGWPTKGKLLSTFLASSPARKGISIGGSEGQNIVAAEKGVVVYSGNGLLGYGELIIIKHNDTYLSAYGHNKSRAVQEGQMVNKGQKIAELGSSGTNVDNLHFEIRKNGEPVNPLNYLPGS